MVERLGPDCRRPSGHPSHARRDGGRTHWGYYPSGGLGMILLILVILALTGRL
ncbi:MAG: DUF3309 family protein [Nitrospira sp.]|nr:MAG: DUF3309 family protein [Nitrospira sp.]